MCSCLCLDMYLQEKKNIKSFVLHHPDDESDSDAEEEQEKTVSLRPGFTPKHTFRSVISAVSSYTHLSTRHTNCPQSHSCHTLSSCRCVGGASAINPFLHPVKCYQGVSEKIFTRMPSCNLSHLRHAHSASNHRLLSSGCFFV